MWIKLIAVTVLITCTPSDQNVCFCSCRSLVDTIYSLKDEVQELKQVSAPIDEHRRHCCSKMRCFQQNARLGIIGTCHSCCPPIPLTLQGQQAHEEDAGRGAAREERVGADHQESFEEHERPQLGWDQPLRSVFISGSQTRVFPDF